MDETSEDMQGKWVVLLNENIIECGDDIKELLDSAKKKHPTKKLILAQVPREGTFIY